MIAVSVTFWTKFEGHSSKRKVWILAGAGSLIFQLIVFFIAPRDLMTLYIFAALNGFCTGGVVVMLWSMLPDTVEFGEWKSGVRDESILFGLNNLTQKGASAIGAGLVGVILGVIGYVPNEPQNETTLLGLVVLSFLAPAIATAFALFVIKNYPLNAEAHKKIVEQLKGQRTSHSDKTSP